ncbi:PA domain-containing protein [Herpetosiphon sp. NSE202]|uniref:PA domain-containing protein n=1 Tax=Herpetosiphon sp. NSE202 TaxID=3351349 RepID=UPI0036454EC1
MLFQRLSRCFGLAVCLSLIAACASQNATPATPTELANKPTVLPTRSDKDSPNQNPTKTPRPAATATPIISGPHFEQVGGLRLKPPTEGRHADLTLYNDLILLGMQPGSCQLENRITIIDVSDPRQPEVAGYSPVVKNVSLEDMDMARIGEQDIAIVGMQPCSGETKPGIQILDITDPSKPVELARFATTLGVHELDLTVNASGQALALLAAPTNNLFGSTPRVEHRAELWIVDLSTPSKPTKLSRWGIDQKPDWQMLDYADLARGNFPGIFLHSVRASSNSQRAYLSYWDAGVIILDIQDPTQPVYLGQTPYPALAEGDAHSVVDWNDGQFLALNNEDFSKAQVKISHPALAEPAYAHSLPFGEKLAAPLSTEFVVLEQACDPKADYPDFAGRFVLIEMAGCSIERKFIVAQNGKAAGLLIYANKPYQELAFGDDVDLITDFNLPMYLLSSTTAAALLSQPEAKATIEQYFDGGGAIQFFDLSDPSKPVEIGRYNTPNSIDAKRATNPTVHNSEVQGQYLYASWYRDGLRMLDISDPSQPKEVAAWPNGNSPSVNLWGVQVRDQYVYVSDFNYGLYVLEFHAE